jgi:hypothetical protein
MKAPVKKRSRLLVFRLHANLAHLTSWNGRAVQPYLTENEQDSGWTYKLAEGRPSITRSTHHVG